MELDIRTSSQDDGWLVTLRVGLDRQETNELFLAGDSLVCWPTEGLLSESEDPLDRSSMFLSEIVSRNGGLRLLYRTEDLADRVARILADQANAVFSEEG